MKTITPVLLLVFIIGAPRITAQNRVNINKKEYSIKSPAGWTVDSSKQMGTDLILFSMLENSADKFRENINVQVQNTAGMNIDLAKYTAISATKIKAMAPDSKIEESKTINTGKLAFQKTIYTATQDHLALKFEQYYYVANKKAYVITFTSELRKFDIFKPVAEEILNSFSLK